MRAHEGGRQAECKWEEGVDNGCAAAGSHQSYWPASRQLRGERRTSARGEEGSLSGPREASVLVRLSAESLSEQRFIVRRETPSLSVILPKPDFARRSHSSRWQLLDSCP